MYIDPSATSYIIQIVAGVVITCGVVAGAFWGKIKAFFQNKKIEMTEKKLKEQYAKKSDSDKA